MASSRTAALQLRLLAVAALCGLCLFPKTFVARRGIVSLERTFRAPHLRAWPNPSRRKIGSCVQVSRVAMDGISPQYVEHIVAARELMKAEGVECLLVTKTPTFFWLTGGRCYVPTIEESGPAHLFLDQEKAVVVTTSIEGNKMRTQECLGFEVKEAAWAGLPGTMDAIITELVAGRSVETDTDSLEAKLDELMVDLTDHDVAAYRALGKDIGEALAEAARSVCVGDSEYKVAGITHACYNKRGIDLVMSAVAHDERISWDRHPLPRLGVGTELKKVCMIATCGRRKGLICSLSRLVCFGEVPAELRTIHDVCMQVDAEINLATVPGKSADELYHVIVKAYTDRGYGEQILQHHQGGLIGYKCRHWIAQPGGQQVIKAGRAYAWNPTIAGKTIGTKSEDTIYVNNNGSMEVLTNSPDWPMVDVKTGDGRTMSRPDILVK
eukprot:CAMPEP_0203960088 /NCGR_PEP_ID=MMETSP0359-20131031/90893_1 /ASSEMBLY_ACC=CAM_ASM_000338 /TAXON_ID=268821 /ORGANISM="Scrippsiella Hangoei, Strain SHTV-5" /LENGTH=438 /DNA_ID=CAMNT_0050894291 /DNA_START=77 /DNA_END=1393 /DNA_ORIENTATION=+